MEDNTNNNIETPNLQSTNTDNTGGIKRWQVNTIIILGLLLLITLGLIFYVIAFKKSPSNNLVSLKTTSTTKKVNNPYKDWLTYTNPTYGYSFKYPPSWIISSNTQNNTDVITATSPNGYKFEWSEVTGPFGAGSTLIVADSSIINIHNTNYYKYYINPSTSGCGIQMPVSYFIVPNTCLTSFSEIDIGTTPPTSAIDKSGTAINTTGVPFININNNDIFIKLILPKTLPISDASHSSLSSFEIVNNNLNLILKSIKF
ncbi:MAG: hypothetical protein ACYDAS_02985 [Patescibacteria group bacterium]